MNEQAQRIAIAEACGWKINPIRNGWYPPNLHPATNLNQEFELPDFLNDLNAMHEAEKVLSNNDFHTYHISLAGVVHRDHLAAREPLPLMTASDISATAAQRAEAFLRTLNLWVETTPTPVESR